MSQIFDALHRSETERRGIDPKGSAAAMEVLEAAERQLADGLAEGKHQEVDSKVEQSCPFESAPVLVPSRSKLVCSDDAESLAAEKFRFLGVRLRHLQQKRPLKRLLITSSMPEEGKSTVAANLASALATRRQQKVLLLEGDLRRPTLALELGLGPILGLGEWLEDGASPRHKCLPTRWLELLYLAGWEVPQRPFGTYAVWKAGSSNGSSQLLVRLDCHRFSAGAAAGRYKHMDASGRCGSFGDATRTNRQAPTPAQSRSDRATQVARNGSQRVPRCRFKCLLLSRIPFRQSCACCQARLIRYCNNSVVH